MSPKDFEIGKLYKLTRATKMLRYYRDTHSRPKDFFDVPHGTILMHIGTRQTYFTALKNINLDEVELNIDPIFLDLNNKMCLIIGLAAFTSRDIVKVN